MADDLKVKVIAQVDQSSAAISKFRTQLQQLADKASKGGVPKIKISVDDSSIQVVKRELAALGKSMKSSGLEPLINAASIKQSSADLDGMISKMNSLIEKEIQLRKEQGKTQGRSSQIPPEKKQENAVYAAVAGKNNFEDYTKKLKPSALTSFKDEIDEIISTYDEIIASGGQGSLPVEKVKAFKATQKNLGNEGGNLLTAIESKIKSLSSYAISTIFTYGALDQLKEGLNTILDIDSALTNINMTMPVTASEMKQIGNKSVDMAKELGTSVQNVMGVAQIYANELESTDNMLQKSRPTVMLSTASGMSGSETADTIQSSLIQFDLAENQAMRVSDVFQKVSANMKMEFKRGTQEIAEGIKTSGSIAKESGYDLEEYAATLGTIIETTRFGGAQVGNALKMVMARVGGAKDDDVTAEEVSKADAAYQQIGITVRDANGEFRKMPDILDDLSAKWENLNSVQRSYIAEASAGNRNRSVFLSMMNNYQRQTELTDQANNAEGFSEETNEKRLESLQAKIEQFKASTAGMWNDVVSSDVLKGLVSLGTGLMNIVTAGDSILIKIGLIVAAVPTLMALFNAIQTTKLAQGFKKSVEDIKTYVNKLIEVHKLMNNKDPAKSLSFGDAMKQTGLSKVGLFAGAATTAVSIGIAAWQAYNAYQQHVIDKGNEIIKNAQEQKQTFTENKNTLEGMKDEFNRLSIGVDEYGSNISLSASDYNRYKEIVAQVLSMYPELIAGYNEENEAIANKNDLLQRAIDLTKEKNKQALLESTSEKNINDAFKGKQKEYEKAYMGNWFGVGGLFQKEDSLIMELGNTVDLDSYIKTPKKENELKPTYLRNHLEELATAIEEIIQEGTDLGTIDDDKAKKLRSMAQTYKVAKKDTDAISKGINSLLQDYALTMPMYDDLDPSQKEYLTDFIDSFRINLISNKDSVADFEGKIMSLVENLYNNKASFSNLSSFDKTQMPAIEWENSVNQEINTLTEKLNLTPEQKKALQIQVGIEFMSDGTTTQIQQLISDVSDTAKAAWGDSFKPEELRLDEWQYALNHLKDLGSMTWEEFRNRVNNARIAAEANRAEVEKLTDGISKSVSAYDTIHDAMEQYNKDGYLSISSLESILSLGDEYLNYLFDENGNLRSLEDAYKDVIKARLEDLKTKKIGELNSWIDQMRTEKKTVDELTTAWKQKAAAQMIGSLPISSGTTYEDSAGNQVDLSEAPQYKAAKQYIDMIDQAIRGIDEHGLDEQSPGSKKRAEEEEQRAKEIEQKRKDLAKAEEDYAKKVEDTNEKLEELNQKGKLEELKNSIEQVFLVLEQFDNVIELLDLKLEFAGEEDFAYRQDVLADKLETTIEKGVALREEFERLAETTPRNADEANELASSLERLGDDLRNNLSNVISLNHELNMLQINAINASANNTVNRLQSMNSVIDYNRKMLTGESMFGPNSAFSFDFLLPLVPRSELEQKRAENESLLAEQQNYEDKAAEIKRVALEKQYQENIAAREKERQQLIADLDEAYAVLKEKRTDVEDLVKNSTAKTTAAVTDSSQQSKAEVENAAAQITAAVTTAADAIANTIIEAPSLGESWNTLLADVQAWVQKMADAVSQLSFTGEITSQPRGEGAEKVINIAQVQAGQKDRKNKYNGYSGEAWCGYFVNWVFKQAGKDIPSQTSVATGAASMQQLGYYRSANEYTPQPGDLIYFDWKDVDGPYNHVGIVTGADANYIYTIEGNTKKDGKSNMVAKQKRPRNDTIIGYAAIPYASGGIVPEDSTILAGEENRELAILPGGKVMILGQNGAGLYTVPEGTRIISNPETEQILKYTGSKINNTQIPRLADGTGDYTITETSEPENIDINLNADININPPADTPEDEAAADEAEPPPPQFNFDDKDGVIQALKQITEIPETFYQTFADDYAAYSKERDAAMFAINAAKEAYSAGDKSMRGQALELINGQTFRDNQKLYNMQLDMNKQAGNILRARLSDVQASYEAAKAKGALDPEVVNTYLESISDLTDKLQNVDNTYMSAMNSMTEFYVQQAQNGLKWHQELWLAQEKEIAYQERQLELTTDFGEKLTSMTGLTKSYREKAEAAKRAQDNAHSNANALFEDGGYYNITSQFSREQIDAWFDANGDISVQLNEDIKLLADSDQHLARQFASILQVEKKFWLESEQVRLDAEDKLRNMQKQIRQTQLDTYNTLYSKVMEMIESNYQAEQKMQETAHQNRMKQLDEQKSAMEDLYSRQMELLDDVKSKEDYQRSLSDEQEKADKLQTRIDVLSLDTSESARMERLNLEKQLAEQKKSIAQIQRDHEFEETKNALQKDLEAQQKHLENLTEEQDAYAQYQQEQLELRYSQEQRAAMATEALASGTFKVISSEGVKTYNDILNKGQGAAMTLQQAYDELATKSGEKFQNMGIEFDNLLNMFREAVSLSNKLANNGVADEVRQENSFTEDTSLPGSKDHITKPDKDSYDLEKWGTGYEDDTALSGLSFEESEALLQKDAAFRESEFRRAAAVIRNRINAGLGTSAQVTYIRHVMDLIQSGNDPFASKMSGILTALGLPAYHTGRAGINSKEDLAVILNTESVLKEDTVTRLARMAELLKSSAPLFTAAAMQRFIPNTKFERSSKGVEFGDINIHIEGNATPETVAALRSESKNLLKQIGTAVRQNSGV